jgi:hypothetical protein
MEISQFPIVSSDRFQFTAKWVDATGKEKYYNLLTALWEDIGVRSVTFI